MCGPVHGQLAWMDGIRIKSSAQWTPLMVTAHSHHSVTTHKSSHKHFFIQIDLQKFTEICGNSNAFCICRDSRHWTLEQPVEHSVHLLSKCPSQCTSIGHSKGHSTRGCSIQCGLMWSTQWKVFSITRCISSRKFLIQKLSKHLLGELPLLEALQKASCECRCKR